ncbi:MAG: MFS transporter [Candidatus Hodarchaeota archaeon]
MDNETEGYKELQKLPFSVYLVGALTQFAVGSYQPFLQAYMIKMGASLGELGAFRSVGNAAPAVLQPAWGATSDRIGHAKAFVAFGTFTGLMIVILFRWAQAPIDMIILYAISSILFSIQIPTWQSLIGGLMSEENRGDELGKLSMVTSTTSLVATLLAGFIASLPAILPTLRAAFGNFGYILFPIGHEPRSSYYILFYMTAIVGIAAALLTLAIRERPRDDAKKREFPPVLKLLSQPGMFRRFCFISVFFSFAMSMAWPYFMVVQVEWLNNTDLQIAIASAVMTATTLIFTIPMSRLSDRVGRKPLILVGRGFLFTVPIMYAFATHVYFIYIANALAGFSVATSFNSITAYIYDIRGSHLAVVNTFSGLVYFCGSLFAGFMGDAIQMILNRHSAVFIMLIASGVLRLMASFLYTLIKEPRVYTSNMRKEIRNLILRMKLDKDID